MVSVTCGQLCSKKYWRKNSELNNVYILTCTWLWVAQLILCWPATCFALPGTWTEPFLCPMSLLGIWCQPLSHIITLLVIFLPSSSSCVQEISKVQYQLHPWMVLEHIPSRYEGTTRVSCHFLTVQTRAPEKWLSSPRPQDNRLLFNETLSSVSTLSSPQALWEHTNVYY